MYSNQLISSPSVAKHDLSSLEGVHHDILSEEELSSCVMLLVDTAGCNMPEDNCVSNFNYSFQTIYTYHILYYFY